MMMTFVNMEAPGITILPTHRVVHGLENFSSPDFITRASRYFTITELTDFALGSDLVHSLSDTTGTAMIAATGDGNYLLTAKPDVIAAELTDIPARQAQLDVVQLHRIILDKLLGLDQETITRLGSVKYIREADEAVALVELRRSRHRLPHQTHHPRPAQRRLPLRRRHAAKIHRLLPQAPKRPRHLRPRLKAF